MEKWFPVAAPDARFQMVDRAGKAVRWQPLRHRIGFQEGAVKFLGARRQDSMKPDGIGHGFHSHFARR